MMTVAEKRYVDEMRQKCGDEGTVGTLIKIVDRLERCSARKDAEYSEFHEHIKEIGGLCELEHDPSVGIEVCLLCHPGAFDRQDDDVI